MISDEIDDHWSVHNENLSGLLSVLGIFDEIDDHWSVLDYELSGLLSVLHGDFNKGETELLRFIVTLSSLLSNRSNELGTLLDGTTGLVGETLEASELRSGVVLGGFLDVRSSNLGTLLDGATGLLGDVSESSELLLSELSLDESDG
jgi:hypothetical protein